MQVGDKVETLLAAVPLEAQRLFDPKAPWVELGGDQGTWITAVAAGVVKAVGLDGAIVIYNEADELLYVYGHTEAPNVHEQQLVTPGRIIAQIALDPGQRAHVAFSVSGPDGPVDPTPYLLEPAAVAEPAEEPEAAPARGRGATRKAS